MNISVKTGRILRCMLIRSIYLGGNFHPGIFPNPVKDKLYITSNGGTIQSLDVSNTDGKTMYHYNNLAAGNSLDMRAFPIGIYFVTIRYASGHAQTMKIVKE